MGKRLFIVAMALPLLSGVARGDELRSAREAVDRALKNDEGGGLVARQSACPQSVDDASEYITRVELAPVGDSTDITLIDSAMCGGGNRHGQYLVVTRRGKSNLVRDTEIGDMSFLGEIMRVDGNKVVLSGNRWLPDDPHCCPSRRAVLEYDVETGKHSLKLTSRKLGK
ncbi:hypothetical protein [Methylocystis sp. JR02]|uniref:hypothetical protein n=1 Tax=Methylocystis sp. JR02 TaxID=3046284 RepID=UPI0024BB4BC4|nr:hypothetical protein [Methylocystis sp. JR02]MDJ0447833.1 hypothetical protein [Methylocystis sp. JR02]